MPLIQLASLPPKTSRSELLQWIADQAGVDARRLGKAQLQGSQAQVEVPDGWEHRLVRMLDGLMFGTRRVRVWNSEATAADAISESHFQRLTRLLEIESQAAARQMLERARKLSADKAEQTGNCLLDLVIMDQDAGLGGRIVVELRKRKRTPLPWTRLGIGSPVLLSTEASRFEAGLRGVVSHRDEHSLRIAFDSFPEEADDHGPWRVDLSSDEVSERRQRAALQRAGTAAGDRLSELREVLLGRRAARFSPIVPLVALNDRLNASQQAAIEFALSAQDVALIHGPPGTGKTTAVIELIRQAVRRGEKVLAAASSNLAVDNLLERLVATGERVVRLGHPARVLQPLREHTLDLMVEEHPDVRLSHKLIRDALNLQRKAARFTRAKPPPGAKQQMRRQAAQLFADARRLERLSIENILDSADIVCATTTGIDSDVLGQRHFDLAVIDEACQSTEPGCWIPLLRADRVVLAGDHCQLPPTVVSSEAAAEGFGISLFERLMALAGEELSRRLTVQYRMHEAIMQFSSGEFYEGELQADASVASHLLAGLTNILPGDLTTTPLEFIDTAGANFDEALEPDGESRFNSQESALLVRKVHALLAAGLPPESIAVIAPYAAQVRLLRHQLRDVAGLEIDSVDGFQGREKEAVLISLVRSNADGEIGFLADVRRTNVALTRARRKLIVIGDSATLSTHPFYQRLLEYFERQTAYHTVWEEPDMLP
jgi:superfamily I DNA and/or RNA helicase